MSDIAQFVQQAVADDQCSLAFAKQAEEKLLAMRDEIERLQRLNATYVRDGYASLDAKDREIERLRALLPDPRRMSGWDDDGCPADVAAYLVKLAEMKNIEVPAHLRTAEAAGGAG